MTSLKRKHDNSHVLIVQIAFIAFKKDIIEVHSFCFDEFVLLKRAILNFLFPVLVFRKPYAIKFGVAVFVCKNIIMWSPDGHFRTSRYKPHFVSVDKMVTHDLCFNQK